MIRRIKRVKPKKRFYPAQVSEPVKTGDEREYLFQPPLQPRKRLLIITSIVFGLWVIGLILMYAFTVYPERHPKHGPSPAPMTPTTQPEKTIPLPPPIPLTPKVPQATTRPSNA